MKLNRKNMKKLEKAFANHLAKYEKYKKFYKDNKGVIKDIEELKCVLDYAVGKEITDSLKDDEALELLKESNPLEYAKLVYKKGIKYIFSQVRDNTYTVKNPDLFRLLDNGNIEGEYSKGMLLFNGQWAEIVEEETVAEKIQEEIEKKINTDNKINDIFGNKEELERVRNIVMDTINSPYVKPNFYKCEHTGNEFERDKTGAFKGFGVRFSDFELSRYTMGFHGLKELAYFHTENEMNKWIEENKVK